ncbi:restriction endonuclease subunit S [Croceicoccus sp. Ery15]|uniref:restriction endonuclease subunit S n=1 Tax=Croceicoccus sp. Ery15 TaxID=1703338 RepID=UPI001E5B42E4|nr:restriction endonuclease subunit S [Croceicoccus sp. Ery15]
MIEGWKRTSIGEIGHVVTGTTPPTINSEYYGGDIPFVAPGDLGKNLFVNFTERTLTAEGLAKAKALPAGAVLFTCIGATIGKSAIAGRELATNQQVNAVICSPQKADSTFVYYLLNMRAEQIKRLAGAQAVPIVNKSTFEDVTAPFPPLSEQRKIAEILRTWDEAIENLEALREAIIKRRVWFRSSVLSGCVRLPGFADEWQEVQLGDVLYEHGTSSNGNDEVYSVSVHKGLINQIEHLGRSFAAANTDHYNRVLPGDIVYTKSPTGDFPLGIIKQSKIDKAVIVSPLYGVFTPETPALGVILDAFFESPVTVRNYLHPLVQKGAKNTIAITNKRFLEGKLHLPRDPEEQQALAAVIEADQQLVRGVEAEIEALQRQKRGLMQKLLTGEWRVALNQDQTENIRKEAAHG